jgi:hypothetical protein
MQFHDWILTSREEVDTFMLSIIHLPFTYREWTTLLETVHFCLASGQKLLWPDTICGRTIRSTCTSHFGLDSGAPNSLGQDYLQVHKPGLTVQGRWWLSRTLL